MPDSENLNSRGGSHDSIGPPAVKEEILPNYEEYLLLLQEKNRLVNKLKKKDKKQIVLEKKEKGFSLYVNGANAKRRAQHKISPSQPSVRHTKTAGDYPRKLGLSPKDLYLIQKEEVREASRKPRLKTAPSKSRKNWAVSSVDIQTARGVKERLKAPEYLTGNYDDDFESDESDNEMERSEVVRSMAVSLDAELDEDIEIDAEKFNKIPDRKLDKRQQMTNKKKLKSKYLRRRVERENNNNNNNHVCYDEEADDNQLIMSINDVKKLRESLEMNASIQKNLAQEVSSCKLPKFPQLKGSVVAQDGRSRKESDDEHSVISEVSEEEEIEEELSPIRDIRDQLQPGDTIVLELAPPRRVEKNLSVSRKEPQTSPKKTTPVRLKTPARTSQDSMELKGSGPKRLSRPTSGCKKTKETNQDPQSEASAVLQALKAENQRVSEFAQEKKSTPRKSLTNLHISESELELPLSARERRRMRTPQSPLSSDQQKISPDFPIPLPQDNSHKTNSPVINSDDSLLTPDKLNKIMTQVQAMPSRQQKNLVKMLGKLEESLSRTEVSSPGNSSTDFTKTLTPSSEGVTNIMIEILSNWGDADRVGLTEIQLYDGQNQLVSVHPDCLTVSGAKDTRGQISCLFNNKCKTNKERNMWSCQYTEKRSVKIAIQLQNPTADQTSLISKIKIWNFNKSLNDLSVGVRRCHVSVDGNVVFTGEVEKGCGNQVFDYSTSISLTQTGQSVPCISAMSSEHSSSTVINDHVNSSKMVTKPKVTLSKLSPSHQCKNIPPLPKSSHRSISPSPNRENRRTYPSLKDSSRSSGSSTSETFTSRVISPAASQEELSQRSQTRTLNHSSDKHLNHPVVRTQPSSPDSDNSQSDPQRCVKARSSKSPRKSKRMAANLQGHGFSDLDISRSYLDSFESRPPRPPDQRIEDRLRPSSLHNNITPIATDDSLFIVQKSKQLPKSYEMLNPAQHPTGPLFSPRTDSRRPSWLDDMFHENVDDTDRRSIPSWLKSEDIDEYFDNPPGSRSVSRVGHQPVIPTSQSKQELLDWDEELAPDLPSAGINHLSSVFGDGKPDSRAKPKSPLIQTASADEALDECTPMQRIEKNRAKWRDNQQKKLEESWGSLNLFNKSHRGRLSIDMTDDALDEYLIPSRKTGGKPVKSSSKPTEPVLEEDDFIIPELPYGRNLEVNIKTTWGDKHYVGMTGIEVFSHTGDSVQVSKIESDPHDINVLPGYGKDPRVVANLIDGVNRTRDDVHMWLAPFTPSSSHFVHITFQNPCRVAMIRIWNYNKSRIHSYRGAKDVEMKLDGCVIFKGEIVRACGGIEGGTEAFGDTILFTVDEEILEAVSKQDSAYEGNAFSDDDIEDDVPFERPSTADDGKDERPFTRASGLLKSNKTEEVTRPQTGMVTVEGDVIVYKGQKLELNFTATWGDLHYLGLTGLEVVGKEGEALPVSLQKIQATPRDVRSLPGHEEDDRTLDKVIDGCNITQSDEHMWLIPFNEGQNHKLNIDFGQKVFIAGLRVWNYNKSIEDTYRGAKIVHVKIDDRLVSPPDGYLVRKGPGNCYFDYAQEISFSPDQKPPKQNMTTGVAHSLSPGSSVDIPSQEYEAVQMPCGFIYQFHLLSTCGDPYYVGLNGLEFYDSELNVIPLAENNIAAYPDSVNVLDNVKNDVRTPDKLINGWNDTADGRHTWLAPVLPNMVNRVYVIFDQPTTVSMIKIWNYNKTPNRGAKDFALLVDDLLVYNGVLRTVGEAARGILPTSQTQTYHTILFTDNKELLRKERHTVISKAAGEQDVQMLNDKKVVTHYSDPKKAQANKPVNQALRPKTSVPAKSKRR